MQVLQLPTDVREDVYGLPGDLPSDFPRVFSAILYIMNKIEVRWCVVGDILLAHYGVPKITEVSTRGMFSFLGLIMI